MCDIDAAQSFSMTVAMCPRDKQTEDLFYFALGAGGRPVFENPQGAMVNLRFEVENLPSSCFCGSNHYCSSSFKTTYGSTATRNTNHNSSNHTDDDDDDDARLNMEEVEKIDEDRFLEMELTESIRLCGWMEEVGGNRNNIHKNCATPVDDEAEVGNGDGEEVLHVCAALQSRMVEKVNPEKENFSGPVDGSEVKKNETILTVLGSVPLRFHVWCAPGQLSLQQLLETLMRKKEEYRKYTKSEKELSEVPLEQEKETLEASLLCIFDDPSQTHEHGAGAISPVTITQAVGGPPCAQASQASLPSVEEKQMARVQTGVFVGVQIPSFSGPEMKSDESTLGMKKVEEEEEMYQNFLNNRNDAPYIRRATDAIITYANILSEHSDIVGEEVFEDKEKGGGGEAVPAYHLIQFHTADNTV